MDVANEIDEDKAAENMENLEDLDSDKILDLKYPENNETFSSRIVVDAYDQNSVRRIHKGDPFKNMPIQALNMIRPDLAKKLSTKKKDKSEEAEQFVDENDILKNDDPFSNFLKEEMGMKIENEKQSNDENSIGDDEKIDQRDESFETFSKDGQIMRLRDF